MQKSLLFILTILISTFVFCFGPLDPNNPHVYPNPEDPEPTPRPTSGVVAYFKFNEQGSQTVADSSIFKNHGTLYNHTWVDTGIHGSALYYNGINSYVLVPNDSSLIFNTGDFTISLWIKPDSSALLSDTSHYDLISKGDSMSHSYTISLFKDSVVGYVGSQTTVSNVKSSSTLFDGKWHNVVMVRRSGTVYVYLDNSQIHYYSSSSAITTDHPLYIGRGKSMTGYYKGLIDEVKLLNKAWGNLELAAEYNRFRS